MRHNLVGKARHQIAQLGDRFIMHPALPGHINHSRGPNIAKELDPCLQSLCQINHSIKSSIANKAGNERSPWISPKDSAAQQARELNERVDDLRLQRAEAPPTSAL